jgi:hypothetical protein
MITASAAAAGSSAGGTILGFTLLSAMVIAYWVPTFVALARHVPNKWQIATVNFFAFFFLFPWVVALVWALKPVEPRAA